jgi:hypothetical protein
MAVTMLLAGMSFAQTASVQLIHNSADTLAAYVDVYLWNVDGDSLLEKLDNFAFRTATPFMTVPAGDSLTAAVADTASTDPGEPIAVIPIGRLTADERYIVVASGVIFTALYAPNPDEIDTGFQLLVYAGVPDSASVDTAVGLILHHGSTDAPTVDIIARDVATLADDIAYTDFEAYQQVPAGFYALDVTPGDDNQTIINTYGADLSGSGGAVVFGFASGFLTPANNLNGEEFGLFAAFADGNVVKYNVVGETEVLFQVDMTVQILNGNFVEGGEDTLDIRGSFNGWSLNPDFFMDENAIIDNQYELLVTDFFPLGIEQAYKYVITQDGNTNWENVTGGGNRLFTITGNEPDDNENGIPEKVLEKVFFGDVGTEDIFTEETNVLFEVDMRPAYAYLAAEDSITFGNAVVKNVDSLYIASGATNTIPEMTWVWDAAPGSPIRQPLRMNDEANNGDMMAGDTVWSISVLFEIGAAKTFVWKYGINGHDNEAGFAENHEEDLPNFPGYPTVRKTFGENGTFYTDYWTYNAIEYETDQVPTGFDLGDNYPNPFNPTTTIDFMIQKQVDVRMEVYNLLGQRVVTLVDENLKAGFYKVTWDGRNQVGNTVSSGVYFYKLKAGDFIETKKMILMR